MLFLVVQGQWPLLRDDGYCILNKGAQDCKSLKVVISSSLN